MCAASVSLVGDGARRGAVRGGNNRRTLSLSHLQVFSESFNDASVVAAEAARSCEASPTVVVARGAHSRRRLRSNAAIVKPPSGFISATSGL